MSSREMDHRGGSMRENSVWLLRDAHRARKQGPVALAERQRTRLADMVAFARAHSPYYRELYQGLPQRITNPTLLPVTSKKALMLRFNDWVTDRAVTLEQVRAFVDNPDLIGGLFSGKYTVVTTSGTTGTRGIFLLDERTLAVTNTLALRMLSSWLTTGELTKIVARGGRLAMVNAMGGHFASATAATRLRKSSKLRAKLIQVLSVHTPLPELVAKLNQFQPAVMAPYASMAALLASEQEAGRLHINPVLMVLAAEGLALDEYDRIARAFDAKVRHSYAASECTFITYSCAHKWLHVNSDWVVLEPVDADYRPTLPGQQSHTVLLSNLANRIQPILRYDLGDSILQRPDPCPCGNPLPAVRVQGRAADVLSFSADSGQKVTVAPLVFGTLVGHIPGIEQFQIVQSTPTRLRIRLRVATGAEPDVVWHAVQTEMKQLLAKHQLDHIILERAQESPEQSAGGKYREIIPLSR